MVFKCFKGQIPENTPEIKIEARTTNVREISTGLCPENMPLFKYRKI